MNIAVPLLIAAQVATSYACRYGSASSVVVAEHVKPILIAADLPGDPYDPPPYGPNPHGGNPHGGDPHDENHDPNLPANNKELDRKNPDPYGGEVPH